MRMTLLVLAAAAVLMGDARPSAAHAWYPWCAQYADQSAITSCLFSTFDQCLATVRGIGGTCVQNWHPAPIEPRRERRWKPFYR
jgi:uncharacterized protein DUF3551